MRKRGFVLFIWLLFASMPCYSQGKLRPFREFVEYLFKNPPMPKPSTIDIFLRKSDPQTQYTLGKWINKNGEIVLQPYNPMADNIYDVIRSEVDAANNQEDFDRILSLVGKYGLEEELYAKMLIENKWARKSRNYAPIKPKKKKEHFRSADPEKYKKVHEQLITLNIHHNHNLNESVWENTCQDAVLAYFQEFKSQLNSKMPLHQKNAIYRQQIMKISSVDVLDIFGLNYSSKLGEYKYFLSWESPFKTIPQQLALKELGYYKGQVDGIVWSKTKTAVAQFEKDFNLKPESYRLTVGEEGFPEVRTTSFNFIDNLSEATDELLKDMQGELCYDGTSISLKLHNKNLSVNIVPVDQMVLSFTYKNKTYTYELNPSERNKSAPCEDVNVSFCVSDVVKGSATYCNVSMEMNSAGQIILAAQKGNQTRMLHLKH